MKTKLKFKFFENVTTSDFGMVNIAERKEAILDHFKQHKQLFGNISPPPSGTHIKDILAIKDPDFTVESVEQDQDGNIVGNVTAITDKAKKLLEVNPESFSIRSVYAGKAPVKTFLGFDHSPIVLGNKS